MNICEARQDKWQYVIIMTKNLKPTVASILALSALLVGTWEIRAAPGKDETNPSKPEEQMSSGPAANTSPDQIKTMNDVLVIGVPPPVELGTQSVFTALPPRDLMARPLTESPGLNTATTVIGREEIRWRNSPLLLDTLQYVPGAWTETRGRKEKQLFSLRGQRYPYPDFLIDGAWFRAFTETAYHLSSANLGQIQVLRSSAGLMLTPESLSGAINLQPRDYVAPELQLDASLGTHLTTRDHVNYGDASERFGYSLGAGYYHTDGAENRNAEENVTDLFARVHGKPTDTITLSLTAFALYGDRQLETALPPASASTRAQVQAFDPFRNHIVIGKIRLEPSEAAVTEIIANFAHREYTFEQSAPAPATTHMERDWEYGVRLTQSLELTDANTLRVSGLFNQWECPTGKRYFWPNPADLLTYMAGIVDEQVLGRWTLNLGYRLSQTYYDEFGGYAIEGAAGRLSTVRTTNEWEDPLHTISAGTAYALSQEWSLLGNFTWGHVAAPLSALTVDLDRPDIETRTKLDLGIRRAWPQFGEVILTAFGVYQDDAAIYANATVTGPDGQPVALVRNGLARSYGLELDTRTRRFDWGTQLFLNVVAMQTEIYDAGDWERDREVPEIIIGGGFSHLWRNWELTFLAKHVGPYENDRYLRTGAAPQELADYVNLSAQLAYWFGKDRRSKVYFGADNLLDQKYSTVNGYPNDGLFLNGGVSLVF